MSVIFLTRLIEGLNMKNLTFVCLIVVSIVSSGCSLVTKGEYLTASFGEQKALVHRADWVTDTAPEPSFGHFRPPLKKNSLAGASFVIYPVIVNEKTISFGPAFLPIIPVLNSWQNPPSKYEKKMRLLFGGARRDFEGIEIFIDQEPLAKEILDCGSDEVLVVTDALPLNREEMQIKLMWAGDSLIFNLRKENTFCFAPFVSFN